MAAKHSHDIVWTESARKRMRAASVIDPAYCAPAASSCSAQKRQPNVEGESAQSSHFQGNTNSAVPPMRLINPGNGIFRGRALFAQYLFAGCLVVAALVLLPRNWPKPHRSPTTRSDGVVAPQQPQILPAEPTSVQVNDTSTATQPERRALLPSHAGFTPVPRNPPLVVSTPTSSPEPAHGEEHREPTPVAEPVVVATADFSRAHTPDSLDQERPARILPHPPELDAGAMAQNSYARSKKTVPAEVRTSDMEFRLNQAASELAALGSRLEQARKNTATEETRRNSARADSKKFGADIAAARTQLNVVVVKQGEPTHEIALSNHGFQELTEPNSVTVNPSPAPPGLRALAINSVATRTMTSSSSQLASPPVLPLQAKTPRLTSRNESQPVMGNQRGYPPGSERTLRLPVLPPPGQFEPDLTGGASSTRSSNLADEKQRATEPPQFRMPTLPNPPPIL